MDLETVSDLFTQYGDDVFRLAYTYLGNRTDAEDICQSVFLRLMEKLPQLNSGKEKAWLLKCTVNAWKNLKKSFWRRNVQSLEDTISFRESQDREIHDVVRRLPPTYRAVIHLYYFEGYDQGEIAHILGISRTAVQTRMSRARTILKKELKIIEE